MAWISNISDLQYYHQSPDLPCYCQTLLHSSDLYLQGVLDIPLNTSNPFSLSVYLLDADGTNQSSDISDYFNVYFAKNVNGKDYFVARLKQFHPEMCERGCWILRVIVNPSNFDYYTERYCSTDCCGQALDVQFESEDFVGGFETSTGAIVIVPPVDPPTEDGPTPVSSGGSAPCGITYMMLETFSDCYNTFTDKMYNVPSTTLSGTAFKYTDKILINAVLRELPATITREYSANCQLQRVQKFDTYLLQSKELIPPAIMRDYQGYFTNRYIFVDGERYEMDTNVLFEEVVLTTSCSPMYRMNIQLRSCNVKQIHGCGTVCNQNSGAFVFGANVVSGNYYDENKLLIGSTCEDVVSYFQAIQGVISVTQLDPEDYDCDFNCGVVVEALPNAYLPTSVYSGGTSPANRVFSVSPDTLPYICPEITPLCTYPVIGYITTTGSVCETPVIGDITTEDIPAEELYIVGTSDWIPDTGTTASRSENAVTFNLDLFNDDLTYDSGDPDAMIPFFSGQIGYISESAWPATDRIITHPDFEALEASMIVQANGYIMYSGYVTSADLTGSTIAFTTLTYILP